MAETGGEVTRLLLRWRAGDGEALTALLPLVYDELRRLARRHLDRDRDAHTLQRTALVHEAYLRIVDSTQLDFAGRAQFFGLASQVMRHVLVDHARSRKAAKRGAAMAHVDIENVLRAEDDSRAVPGAVSVASDGDIDFEAVDQALLRLQSIDAAQVRLVELRFFGGLSIPETAEMLDVSPATVKREWALARAWLQRELTRGMPA
jgi:RNA polymerase sigma factor (TIGR02999 family)